jgi:hypothetical protein
MAETYPDPFALAAEAIPETEGRIILDDIKAKLAEETEEEYRKKQEEKRKKEINIKVTSYLKTFIRPLVEKGMITEEYARNYLDSIEKSLHIGVPVKLDRSPPIPIHPKPKRSRSTRKRNIKRKNKKRSLKRRNISNHSCKRKNLRARTKRTTRKRANVKPIQ